MIFFWLAKETSLSLYLWLWFLALPNIIATSLHSYGELVNKYKNAKQNLSMLEILGALTLHGVDATEMKFLPDLKWRKFHRIIFNFPHGGFHHKEDHPHLISKHRNLVRGFFQNASRMLWPDGEIHVTHKIKAPFSSWRIVDLALDCSLHLVGLDDFRITDYPGYNNKRGSGSRCDQPFYRGKCRTFKFKLRTFPKNYLRTERKFDPIHPMSQKLQLLPRAQRLQPHHFTALNNERIDATSECCRIFGGYLNHVEETFGRNGYDMYRSVHEALKFGFESYMGAVPGRPLSGYIVVLEELHRLSSLRLQRLKEMLLRVSRQP